MAKVPGVLWAQRDDRLFITIDVKNSVDNSFEITEEKLKYSGKNKAGVEYELELEFFAGIDAEESKRLITDHRIFLTIIKKESGDFWPRLLKEKRKMHWLKVDFDRWADSDDEEEDTANVPDMGDMEGFGGMPPGMAGMPGMGGMGGMGGMPPGMAGMPGMGGMGGMGGAGGGMDMQAMMAQLAAMKGEGGAAGPPTGSLDVDEDDVDSDDDDMPDLE